ncbi:MAG: rRNA pseudouridine synthase [Bacilli bacterium]|nr:rRNA pseudouridine synthase [Bacilli bacterium]
MERLQKVIANSGYTSRRKAEELISAGKVSVNGSVVTELGVKVSDTDAIMVEGRPLSKTEKKVYYLLNKPSGYICSLKDEKGRKVVTDLIDTNLRVYPVGRLDYDTTGLLILTNDGDFANLLSHPSNNVEKTYRATIDGILTVEDIYQLKDGVDIDGVKVVPTRVKIKKKNVNKNTQIVELSIVEGRNHIVKRVFEKIGHPVLKLKRERYAFLDVEDLRIGEYRDLTVKEVKKLKELKK